MKTLIIPDIHTNYKLAEKIISKEKADKVVFLGDYFDEFDDNSSIAANVASWLKESLCDPTRIHLFGNHDVNYAFHHESYKCSGYSAGKDISINSILNEHDWKKLKLFTWVGSWLCTHAGVHPYWYNTPTNFKVWLEEICEQSLKQAFKHQPAQPFLRAGYSRWGTEKVGGIIWCDSDEFVPINNVNQIFGHSKVPTPQWYNKVNISTNICIDNKVNLNNYIVHNMDTDDIDVKDTYKIR
jgi:hypothetical protein